MEQGRSDVRMRIGPEDRALLLEFLFAERKRLEQNKREQSHKTKAKDVIAFRLGAIKMDDRLGRVNRLIERLERL